MSLTWPRGISKLPDVVDRFQGGESVPRPLFPLLTLAALLACAACVSRQPAAGPAEGEDTPNDPAEPANRTVFRGNQYLDRHLLHPVATAYHEHVPEAARHGLHNFVTNLTEPRVLVNDLLQGNVTRAWNTAERFVINSTVGGAGLFDVADSWNLPRHEADFGQTLGVWGFGPGPAVELPLLGPSNLRDTVGRALGFATNPLVFVPGAAMAGISAGARPVGAVDDRERLLPATDALEASSLDYYAALRSAHAQRRERLVAEGRAGLVQRREPVPSVEIEVVGVPPVRD